jgi:ubiquinone/menaquinone biosynthesis C-methylase UbiE
MASLQLLTAAAVLSFAAMRDEGDKDTQLLAMAGIRAGTGTVCEIGAGDGSMSIRAARIAGPASKVYASELGENKLRQLREKVAASGAVAKQITVVESDPGRTNFPEGGCDAVILRDVYHHLSDPAGFNRSIMASLKPGGRLGLLDFTPPGKEGATPADRAKDGTHGVYPETVNRELAEAGFQVMDIPKSPAGKGRWFMVVVTKPPQTGIK